MPYEKVGKNEPVCIADEVPFDIPDSWEWVRLGMLTYNHGQTTPTTEFSYIDIGSIDNQNQKLNVDENIIPSEKAPSRARKIVEYGDILYSTVRPYLHNMCIVDRAFSKMPIASTGFAVLTCHAEYVNEFLFYYMMAPDFDNYANNTDNAKGVAYPAINDTRLYQALIPVPPVAEQLRIISAFKSILPYIDDYRNAETQLSDLNSSFPERLKKSILQWAVQGKLVPQDPSDEPAEALLERIRVEKQRLIKEGKIKKDKHESVIFRRDNSYYEKLDGVERCIDDDLPFNVPKNWCWCRLRSIANVVSARRVHQSDWRTEGVPFYRAREIGKLADNGFVDNELYISEDLYTAFSTSGVPRPGDLMVTAVGTLGKTYIVQENDRFYYKDASVICFENYGNVDAQYLKLVMETPYMEEQITQNSSGTTVGTITIMKANEFLIPVPPLTEQKRIVKHFNTLKAYVHNL